MTARRFCFRMKAVLGAHQILAEEKRVQKKTRSKVLLWAACTAVIGVVEPVARATDYNWTNFTDASTKSWFDPANWGGAGVPNDPADNANLSSNSASATTDLNIGISSDVSLLSLTMGITPSVFNTTVSSTGGGFTFANNGTINSNGAAGVINTISAPITLNGTVTATGTVNLNLSGDLTNSGGNRTLNFAISPDAAAAGTITVSGNVFLSEATATSPRVLQFGASGSVPYSMVISGVVSDGGAAGSGVNYRARNSTVIYLTNANTNTGSVQINGNLVIRNDQALGFGQVEAGTTTPHISADDAPHTLANNFRMNSQGFIFEGAQDLTIGGFLYTFNSRSLTNNLDDGHTLTLNGPFMGRDSKANSINGTGKTVINGGVYNDLQNANQGAAGFQQTGTGTVVLAAPSYFSGNGTISDGVLQLAHPGALSNSGNVTTIKSSSTAAGVVDLNGQSPNVGKNFVMGNGSAASTDPRAALINNNTATPVTINDGISVTASGTGFTSVPTLQVTGGGGTGGSATVTGLIVGSLNVSNGGSYTSVPTATLSGGGGTGAEVKINSLKVGTISLASGGSGYTAPTVTISGGGGSGATATAEIDPSGVITGITITNAGTGYTSVPTITISDQTGGTGAGATASADLALTGGGITITNFGKGYTSLPTISVTGGGTGGTVDVTGLNLTQDQIAVTPGSGYTSAPSVTVVGDGTGTGTGNFGGITMNSASNIGGAGNLTVNALISGAGGPVKIGAGTTTLTNANNYSGETAVEGGTLVLIDNGTHNSQVPVFSGAGLDIRGGKAVFDYNGGTSQAANIQAILTAGYEQALKFSSGGIRSTAPTDSTLGLGWLDDSVAKQTTVAYTYYGDSNLDGIVNSADFTTLAQNFNAIGADWSEGDFNYDGVVNALDFNLVATNYGSPALFAPGAALGSLVPEPACVGLGASLLLLARRRRRGAP
jgi:autotransporter-associated beta strand protein